MTLDDFVMLGKTVPETNSDGRQFVCTAGYSMELRQAVRIYPMARRHCPARWSVSCVPVERNPKDTRRESWKIRGDRRPGAHAAINEVIRPVMAKLPTSHQREIVADLSVPSLKVANERRLSLCVVLPTSLPRLDLEQGEAVEMAPTPDMFGETSELPVATRFRWHPRLRFADDDGAHDLMLRDWGCYELMRKHGDEAALSLGEALNLSTAPPLLCGNLTRFRTSWLVISVFSGTAHARPEVFDRQFSLFEEAAA